MTRSRSSRRPRQARLNQMVDGGDSGWTGLPGATGTGTDTIVVACSALGDGPRVRYSGTHTSIGEMIGRLVGHGVHKGLTRL